jgi:hypothetical protein
MRSVYQVVYCDALRDHNAAVVDSNAAPPTAVREMVKLLQRPAR